MREICLLGRAAVVDQISLDDVSWARRRGSEKAEGQDVPSGPFAL